MEVKTRHAYYCCEMVSMCVVNPVYYCLIPAKTATVTENNDVDKLSTVYTLPVESLEVGQTIGAVFRNPNDGWVGLTLVTENGDFVLRIAVVVNYGGGKNIVILYAKENGVWQNPAYLYNFPFPESGVTTRMVVSATVEEEGFAILLANGEYLTSYPYQGSLTYDKVKAIVWGVGDESATVKSVLRQISITFPRQE